MNCTAVVRGTVSRLPEDNADEQSVMVLDTRSLNITSIEMLSLDGGKKGSEKKPVRLEFKFGDTDPVFGTALTIRFPKKFCQRMTAKRKSGNDAAANRQSARAVPANQTGGITRKDFAVRIMYTTAPGEACTALNWFDKSETDDKKHPFVFAECHPIHARSLFPCHDTPSSKTTFSANITVPDKLVVVMTALETSVMADEPNKLLRYSFTQNVPMSSYLFTLAIGKLECTELSPRSRVWATADSIVQVSKKLHNVEAWIKAGEELAGPYEWGRFDVLVLPSNAPYGGLEKPGLACISADTVASESNTFGDCLAHEIAHSWHGNLVTASTWESYWMNEGFSVFMERRLVAKVEGAYKGVLKAALGWQELMRVTTEMGVNSPGTTLQLKLGNYDPQESFSVIAFEKGCALLDHLEDLVGGPTFFEPFMLAYIDQFKFNTVDASAWKSFFIDFFRRGGTVPQQVLMRIDWDAWLKGTGVPPLDSPPAFTQNSAIKPILEGAKAWLENGIANQPSTAETKAKWNVDEKLVFLGELHMLAQAMEVKSKLAIVLAALPAIESLHGFSDDPCEDVRGMWDCLCDFLYRNGGGDGPPPGPPALAPLQEEEEPKKKSKSKKKGEHKRNESTKSSKGHKRSESKKSESGHKRSKSKGVKESKHKQNKSVSSNSEEKKDKTEKSKRRKSKAKSSKKVEKVER